MSAWLIVDCSLLIVECSWLIVHEFIVDRQNKSFLSLHPSCIIFLIPHSLFPITSSHDHLFL